MVLIPSKDAGEIAPYKDTYNLIDKTNMKPFWDGHIINWARLTWASDVATGFNDLCCILQGREYEPWTAVCSCVEYCCNNGLLATLSTCIQYSLSKDICVGFKICASAFEKMHNTALTVTDGRRWRIPIKWPLF